MRLTDRTCVCGCVIEDEPGLTDYDFANKHGLGTFMNVRSGLTFLYVCPKCYARAKGALDTLVDVFGKLAEDLFFSNHLKVKDDATKDALQDQDRKERHPRQRCFCDQGYPTR